MTLNIEAFIQENQIKVTALTLVDDYGLSGGGRTYEMTLSKADGKEITHRLMTGGKWEKDPTAYDLLYIMWSDAKNFEEFPKYNAWCKEYGLDSSPERNKQAFLGCQKNAAMLLGWLGTELYRKLIDEVDG